MKFFKIFFIFIVLCALSLSLVMCSNRDELNANSDENLSTITLNLNNKAFGAFLIESGVKDVKLESQKNDILTFSLVTQKDVGFRKVNYNLSNYKFKIQNNKLSLKEFSIQKIDDEYIIYKNNSKIDIKSNKEYLNDFNLVILGVVYDELSKKTPVKYDEFMKSKASRVSGSCAWWNTHTITGVGWTSGGAQADLFYATIQDANDGELKGCTSLGGVETNSRLGGLYYTATQSFCCP